MISRYIKVRHQYEGFHWYEDAPDQVAFLKLRHRHLFKLEATVEVFHNDRELEFFMVKDALIHEILAYTCIRDNLGSCEQQAEAVLIGLVNKYGNHRYYEVVVSEDGESDGIVEHEPESTDFPSGLPGIWKDHDWARVSQRAENFPHRGVLGGERANWWTES